MSGIGVVLVRARRSVVCCCVSLFVLFLRKKERDYVILASGACVYTLCLSGGRLSIVVASWGRRLVFVWELSIVVFEQRLCEVRPRCSAQG